MGSEHLLDLQGGDLVAAALDDVDARSTEQPIRAVFEDGDVAGPEPAVVKRLARAVRPLPVLRKDAGAFQLELAIDET